MELLSVQDYAERAGISLQGAYKRLNGSLKNRIHKVDGKTFIDVSGLDLIEPVESKEENKVEDTEPLNLDNADNNWIYKEILQEKFSLQATIKGQEDLILSLRQQIEGIQSQYQAQLMAKDETIRVLQAQIQSQQQQLDKLAELLHQAQQIQIGQQLAIVQNKPSLWQRLFHRK